MEDKPAPDIKSTASAKKGYAHDYGKYPKKGYLLVPFFRYLFTLIAGTFWGLRWKGTRLIPNEGPYILAANHQSFLDPPLIGTPVSHRRFRYMANEKYFNTPVGWVMRNVGGFPIDLKARFDRRAYQWCLETLRGGDGMILFPEGTRTHDGMVRELETGTARMALLTGAALVPVAITGFYDIWPRHAKRPRLGGRMFIKYYRPILVEKCDKPSELSERAESLSKQVHKILDRRVRAYERWKILKQK